MKKLYAMLLFLLLAACLLTGCGDSTSKPEEFVIKDGILTRYNGKATRIEIPEGVTGIGQAAFRRNEKIKSVVIPDSCRWIGYEAFWGCKKLAEVKLPDNGIRFSRQSFLFCSKLKSLDIPESADLNTDVFSLGGSNFPITPCPKSFNITGVINYKSGVVLCNMRATEEGQLRLTFKQDWGKIVPVSFGAGGVQAQMRVGFDVRLRMADGRELDSIRSEAQFDEEFLEYRYVFWFPTTERPKTVVCVGAKEVVELDGVTWRKVSE